MNGLTGALSRHHLVGVDTSIFIYVAELPMIDGLELLFLADM